MKKHNLPSPASRLGGGLSALLPRQPKPLLRSRARRFMAGCISLPAALLGAEFETVGSSGEWIVQVEAAEAVSHWQLENEHEGFAGQGYYAWRGPHVKHLPGTAVLTYHLQVAEPGLYQMTIRARRDQEGSIRRNWDEVNDVFVRLDGSAWVKVSHKTPWGEWGEIRSFSTEEGLQPAVYNLGSGPHRFEIAARSDNVKIDLIKFSPVMGESDNTADR